MPADTDKAADAGVPSIKPQATRSIESYPGDGHTHRPYEYRMFWDTLATSNGELVAHIGAPQNCPQHEAH